MALHDSLRELVSVRGSSVVDEADELRGALDDFLAEDEATLGELNLLVDAVRLGALRRVLDVMAHGAEPQAAILEAGAALARDRGTDDPTRSCWALSVLCFALGKVDDASVRLFRSDAGTLPAATPPTAPHGPAPVAPAVTSPVSSGDVPPVLRSGTVDRPRTLSQETDSAGAPPPPTTAVQLPSYEQPSEPSARRSSRGGVALLMLLVVLIIGGLLATGVILLRDKGDDDAADSGSPTGGATGRSSDGGSKDKLVVPDSAMLVPYKDEATGLSAIYQVDLSSGARDQVSAEDVDARLPTLAPDRRTMTYEDFTGLGPDVAGVLTVQDLGSDAAPRAILDPDGPCAHTLRPGWSLDGSRFAVICTGDDDVPEGIYVVDADGSDPQMVVEDSLVRGSPTWISATEFVYGTYGSTADDASGLRLIDADIGGEATSVPTPEGFRITHADWSPEAGKLLFLTSPADSDKEVGSIWTMNATGTGQQVLADGEYQHPVWSPGGTQIAVTIEDGSGDEVLAYLDVDDPSTPHVIDDPPPGQVGIPVWATR